MKSYISLFILLFSIQIYSQSSEDWIALAPSSDHAISVNVNGLEKFTDNYFFVWSFFEYNSPMQLEEISDDIKKAKYYYIFNKETEKYSLLQVIYYNSKNNVIKSFSYNRDTDNAKYNFNFPIYDSGDEREIFNFCSNYITKANSK
ncbi:MAG: hypothetical protein M0P71_16295 [Melioribacteraceae bacterium]|nr:hypothetical protein [Melioribacteraceae bacterium]